MEFDDKRSRLEYLQYEIFYEQLNLGSNTLLSQNGTLHS